MKVVIRAEIVSVIKTVIKVRLLDNRGCRNQGRPRRKRKGRIIGPDQGKFNYNCLHTVKRVVESNANRISR